MTAAFARTAEPRRVPHIDYRPRDNSPDAVRGRRAHYLECLRAIGVMRRMYVRWSALPEWGRPCSLEYLRHQIVLAAAGARQARGEMEGRVP